MNLLVCGERPGALEMTAKSGVLLVKAAEEIHDEGAVSDNLTQITKLLGEFLVLVTIICHRKITLTEVPEFGIAVDGAGFLMTEELILDGEPGGTGRGVAGDCSVGDVGGDGPDDP
jgi:hypothetical protein